MNIQAYATLLGHRPIDYDFFTNQAHSLRSAALRDWFAGSSHPAPVTEQSTFVQRPCNEV